MDLTALDGRLAWGGIALVFLFLLAFGLWVAFTTKHVVERVEYSSTLREDYDRARHGVLSEESLERKYRLEPEQQYRDRHEAAAAETIQALQTIIIQDGRTENQEMIGVAICRRVAERHDGEITAQSIPGLGLPLSLRCQSCSSKRDPTAQPNWSKTAAKSRMPYAARCISYSKAINR